MEDNKDYKIYFAYLNGLRESAMVNMFGAGEYLVSEFGVNKYEASKILSEWMAAFSEGHKFYVKNLTSEQLHELD